jgi:hypothetical protein
MRSSMPSREARGISRQGASELLKSVPVDSYVAKDEADAMRVKRAIEDAGRPKGLAAFYRASPDSKPARSAREPWGSLTQEGSISWDGERISSASGIGGAPDRQSTAPRGPPRDGGGSMETDPPWTRGRSKLSRGGTRFPN